MVRGSGRWFTGGKRREIQVRNTDLTSFAHLLRSYLDQLKFTEAYLEDLSSQTSKSLGHLEALEKSFKSVEAQTSAFRKQCETLTTEQSRLEGLATDLGENLQYYKFLEPITRRFNAPGAGNLVRGQEFSSMLARLDECLEYMNTHVSDSVP